MIRAHKRPLTCWFHSQISTSDLNVKVMGGSSRSHEENVVKVVGATSSEAFDVQTITYEANDLCSTYCFIL